MRSIKLTTAVAAAATVLTLAPASALAGRGHFFRGGRHAGQCRVGLNVAEREIAADETVSAFGRLSCPKLNEVNGQTVTLYQDSAGSPGFTAAGTTTTDKTGAYDLSSGLLTANTRFYVVANGVQSPRRTVKVTSLVTLAGPPEGTLTTGHPNKVIFTGTVSPEDAGALVVLQRQDALTGNEWHRIQFGRVLHGGTFTITHTFVVPGAANIRVVIRSQGRNAPGQSNILTYNISQAENEDLTINAAPNPITFGESVKISGKAKEAPNTMVTLLAHTVHQGSFAPVTQVKTNGSGEYEFPAQSPVDSTFYKVQDSGKTSAVLFEGVRDVLTAAVSPGTTIQQDETLKFSGTVSPEHVGHAIYLERQNPSGTAFHVIEVSSVLPGSTYSILHTIYKVGTSVFRVRVPGDPQNGGAVSPPFTITVTPAPASALTPEAPGNSTLPPEGQV